MIRLTSTHTGQLHHRVHLPVPRNSQVYPRVYLIGDI